MHYPLFMIVMSGVSKRYGKAEVLKPLSLDFPPGKVTALIGPSGSGKSTVLRLLVGLIEPDAGEIWINGERLTAETMMTIRRKLGYVIQEGGLFPHLTAGDNVLLLARQIGRESEVKLNELASLTQLPPDALDRFPLEVSGGQRQRVALMRALALSPETLLLDEPLGALDPMIRADLQRDLKEIFGKVKQTVILVTHDMGEAAYLADHIVLMREGRIVQQGTLKEFQEQPAEPFVTDFLNAQRTLVAL